MKRFPILAAVAMLLSAAAFAQPMMGARQGPGPSRHTFLNQYESAEIDALKAEFAGKSLGELTGTEVEAWAERLAIAARKDAWIRSSMGASMRFPGRGQLKNGDGLDGGLFAAAHVATIAGTAAAWYLLLPSRLKFDQLNYYTSPFSTIKASWEGISLQDYLPSMAAMAGGMALDMVWRVWSAKNALDEARAGIESGKVELKPLLGPGMMGFRMRY